MTDKELGLHPKKTLSGSQLKVYTKGLKDAKKARHTLEVPLNKDSSHVQLEENGVN